MRYTKVSAYLGNATNRVCEVLTRRRKFWFLALGVGLACGLFALVVFGRGFIAGTGPYWQQPLYDAGTHVSGWYFFKEDAWKLPVFDTSRAEYPDGISIVLTDSLPLLALVFKLLGMVGDWHYFGMFIALCYMLNALSILWVLRQCRVQHVLGAIAAIVFACFTTLHNIQFESFFAHFFIILSVGFYVRLMRNFVTRDSAIFLALVVTALLIHPYIFAMCAALFTATIISAWRSGCIGWKVGAAWLLCTAAMVGTMLAITGYVSRPSLGYKEQLYGAAASYALDVAALFKKVYTVDEIGQYLGAGYILLAVVAAWYIYRCKKALVRRHLLLAFLLVACVLFAITNTFYFDGQPLAHIGLPRPVLAAAELFRASKRFIVPVYHTVLLVSLVVLLQRQKRWAIAVVVVALCVQVADTAFFVRSLHDAARRGQPVVLDHAAIAQRLQSARVLAVYPSYSCMFNLLSTHSLPISTQWSAAQELYQMAAEQGKVSNSIRAARRVKNCDAEKTDAQQVPKPYMLAAYLKDDNGTFIIDPPRGCSMHKDEHYAYLAYCGR